VLTPAQAPGDHRAAAPADFAWVMQWYRDFNDELRLDQPLDITARMLEGRLRGEGGGGDIWEVSGSPVSLVAYARSSPHSSRIGPVYTPPGHRGLGYARTLTALTTKRLLSSGDRCCFLYTDLANPTSNRLYRSIGYRQACVSEDWRFSTA